MNSFGQAIRCRGWLEAAVRRCRRPRRSAALQAWLLWIGLAAVTLSLATGCGGDLSEQEYAELVCGPELLEGALYGDTDDVETLTYGQMDEAVGGLIERLEAIDPPEAYEGHLRYLVAGQQHLLQAVRMFPPDRRFRVVDLQHELSTYAELVQRAMTELPPVHRERLHASGCDEIVFS